MVPTRTGERLRPNFDEAADRERDGVERLIDRLRQFRRTATRCERPAHDLAVVQLGMTMLRLPALAGTA